MTHSGKIVGRLAAASIIIASLAGAGCAASSAEPESPGSASPTPAAGPQADYPGMPQLPPDVDDKGAATPAPPPQQTTAANTATPEPEVPDYAELARSTGSGVFSVVATGCGPGSRIGSAFLVGKRAAVTSYAVVAGAKVVALTAGSQLVSAQVSSAAPEFGVAVLELDRAVDGHLFSVVDEPLETGDPVGLLGFESTVRKVGVTTAEITETDVALEPGGTIVSGLAQADVEIDPGRGGGPTLTADGDVNGMALGGPRPGTLMVVPGGMIADGMDGGWPESKPNCDDPTGPDLTVVRGDPPAAVHELFTDYFGGINTGDYRQAYDRLGPLSRQENDFDGYRSGWTSSYDFDITVHSANGQNAHVTFNSIFQAGKGPKDGLTCARWDVDYALTKANGQLLINKAEAHDGGKLWRPC